MVTQPHRQSHLGGGLERRGNIIIIIIIIIRNKMVLVRIIDGMYHRWICQIYMNMGMELVSLWFVVCLSCSRLVREGHIQFPLKICGTLKPLQSVFKSLVLLILIMMNLTIIIFPLHLLFYFICELSGYFTLSKTWLWST